MSKQSEYTAKLFELYKEEANVSEFIELYTETFDEAPSQGLIKAYQSIINDEADDSEESYGYDNQDIYGESYSYD